MKIFGKVFIFIAISTSLFQVTQAQAKRTAEDEKKLDRAQKLASQFVERFRQTLDFGTVWKEFHSSNTACAIRLTPTLPSFKGAELKETSFEQRLRGMGLDKERLERFHISYWNLALLSQAYYYSIAPSTNGSEPNIETAFAAKTKSPELKEFAALYVKYLKLLGVERMGKSQRPQTAKDFDRLISDSDQLAVQFKKHAPKDILGTANWRSAIMWFDNVHDVRQINDRTRYADFCDSETGPIYVAQIGFFVLEFVEEGGELKLFTMSYIDD